MFHMMATARLNECCDPCRCMRGISNKDIDQFSLNIHVRIFKKEHRDQKVKIQRELQRYISALRNTRGGVIFVHLDGHDKHDNYLGYINDFISNIFDKLIEDGILYVDSCKCELIKACRKQCVCLNVNPTPWLATVDYNTKVRTDFQNISPSALNIVYFLHDFKSHPEKKATILTIPFENLQLLQESRCIELKAYRPPEERVQEIESNINKFLDYLWFDLKLKDNITSLSRISTGGSIFVGIEERKDVQKSYESKIPTACGFVVPHPFQEIKTFLKKVISNNMTVLRKDKTFDLPPEDLTEMYFSKVPDSNKKGPATYVLQVAVRYCKDMVFYEKGGPEAYKVVKRLAYRMSREEWLSRMDSYVRIVQPKNNDEKKPTKDACKKRIVLLRSKNWDNERLRLENETLQQQLLSDSGQTTDWE